MSCDIDFTDVEVNAMNMLGLQYTLDCKVVNKDVLDDYAVLTFASQRFPMVPGTAKRQQHVVYATFEPMATLHERRIGRDKLVAELTLTNEETHTKDRAQTEVITVDLAA